MIATSEVGVSMSIDNDSHLNDIVAELKSTEPSQLTVTCV